MYPYQPHALNPSCWWRRIFEKLLYYGHKVPVSSEGVPSLWLAKGVPDKLTLRNDLSNLTVETKDEKLPIIKLIEKTVEQKSTLDDHLHLLCTEPIFLSYAVNIWFYSRPELIQDEKGRVLPLITDNYISAALFEVIENGITGATI
jgi:hypothetical protein